ncbi:methyltransferase domain-containing protein [Ideonella sp. DXS29W]|uniref:Methyltransferase domain-containing protein n=1 Tax=Ideonella lacteola TaxID=2984193 RepID=A0ABU9BTA6_9BURK
MYDGDHRQASRASAAPEPADRYAGLQRQDFWEEAWVRHIEQYLATPPRAGLWLAARFDLAGWSMLEIAGGSCRDSRYLAERGVNAIGSDFDQKTLDYLARRYPDSPLTLACEDASALSMPDRSVDLSMHNGFWVLFADDERLVALLREQARVTRRVLVALVHNADNPRVVAAFARKAKTDPLYDIRFFRRAELLGLVTSAGLAPRRISLEKFGGPVDRLLSLPGVLGRGARWIVPRLYRLLPWRFVERTALVLEF